MLPIAGCSPNIITSNTIQLSVRSFEPFDSIPSVIIYDGSHQIVKIQKNTLSDDGLTINIILEGMKNSTNGYMRVIGKSAKGSSICGMLSFSLSFLVQTDNDTLIYGPGGHICIDVKRYHINDNKSLIYIGNVSLLSKTKFPNGMNMFAPPYSVISFIDSKFISALKYRLPLKESKIIESNFDINTLKLFKLNKKSNGWVEVDAVFHAAPFYMFLSANFSNGTYAVFGKLKNHKK